MIEASFGAEPPLAVGVEEELWILDAESLALAPEVDALVEAATRAELPGALKPELFASVVESTTRPVATVAEALAALRALRRAAAAAASELGLAIAASGSHPFSPPEAQQIHPDPRYLDFVAYAGPSARRQGVCGLHVHVSMPDADSAFRVLEWTLPWLPVLLAASANSPYLAGAETGLLSTRAEVLALLPRSGAPPAFASYADWEEHVERFSRLGIARDYTSYWWDVRLHPRLGTLELRVADLPTDVALGAAFAALLQAMAATALAEPPAPVRPARRGDYAQNRWAAARFGPAASLIHPDGERAASAAELLVELLERVAPAAAGLGTASLLAPLAGGGCEAERQLAVGRAEGLPALCADLVERSLG